MHIDKTAEILFFPGDLVKIKACNFGNKTVLVSLDIHALSRQSIIEIPNGTIGFILKHAIDDFYADNLCYLVLVGDKKYYIWHQFLELFKHKNE